MRLDSFFSGALCVMSGGRLPAALFMVFLLDSKGAKGSIVVCITWALCAASQALYLLNLCSPYSHLQSGVLFAPSGHSARITGFHLLNLRSSYSHCQSRAAEQRAMRIFFPYSPSRPCCPDARIPKVQKSENL